MIVQMPNIQSTGYINIRRSQRVVLSLPIMIRGRFEDGSPCVETSHTLVVNAHGALIVLIMKVNIQQSLVLQNLRNDKEQPCRVVRLGERKNNLSEIGVEFTEPAPNFWDISFPPADWKPSLD
jgi:hypothetical protein